VKTLKDTENIQTVNINYSLKKITAASAGGGPTRQDSNAFVVSDGVALAKFVHDSPHLRHGGQGVVRKGSQHRKREQHGQANGKAG
jgi:hypothetical protein